MNDMAPVEIEDIAQMDVDDIVSISSDSETENQKGFRPCSSIPK